MLLINIIIAIVFFLLGATFMYDQTLKDIKKKNELIREMQEMIERDVEMIMSASKRKKIFCHICGGYDYEGDIHKCPKGVKKNIK